MQVLIDPDVAAIPEAERPRVLLVDDDAPILRMLERTLTAEGYDVVAAADGGAALAAVERNVPDAIVLDVSMPGMDGLAVTRRLRAKGLRVPILLLTARGDADDRIRGLEAGADDYLGKPFEPRELLLRINAILRRVPKPQPKSEPPKTLQLGEVRYDMGRGELWRGRDLIRLTATEAMLMRIFAARPNAPVTRQELVEDLGGGIAEAQERAIDVQITRLRRKIEEDPKAPRYLQTVRGSGYMLAPD